ncbi:MAG: M48 family metalloprotease [Fulvivirga sp.]|uniref:M48 family metalloprotease n=1 Tax=Fulvivirga sp. TaxID=1931237 RepID=UPI0032EAFF8D
MIKIFRYSLSAIVLCGMILFSACDENNNLVLFSVQNDIDLGAQVAEQINNDPQYVKMARADYPEAYSYLDAMVLEILDNGDVAYREEFVWEVTLLEGDVLNAFATPGGYIYVYTGLIKYLDNADDLAGVIGHEIAHADLRHTSRNLQKQYGVQILLSIILGENASQLATIAGQVAGSVAGLSFSREFESESDARAVEYNANTIYACDGVKNFFQKLEDSGQTGGTPEFLSTHPSPDTRIADIVAKAQTLSCDTDLLVNSGYADFQASLP